MPRANRSVLIQPITIGLVVPAILIAVDPWRRSLETPSLVVGIIMVLSGLAMVTRTAREIPEDGRNRLVTGGSFAHSRNPMYLGVLAMLAGLSMASRSPVLGIYLLSAAVGLHLRVVLHHEPQAERDFPDAWHEYCRRVPRWFPRLGAGLPLRR